MKYLFVKLVQSEFEDLAGISDFGENTLENV